MYNRQKRRQPLKRQKKNEGNLKNLKKLNKELQNYAPQARRAFNRKK